MPLLTDNPVMIQVTETQLNMDNYLGVETAQDLETNWLTWFYRKTFKKYTVTDNNKEEFNATNFFNVAF